MTPEHPGTSDTLDDNGDTIDDHPDTAGHPGLVADDPGLVADDPGPGQDIEPDPDGSDAPTRRRRRDRDRQDHREQRPRSGRRLGPRPPGTQRYLVLGAGTGEDDIVALDLASNVLVRLHGGLPALPDGTIEPFDVVDATLSSAGSLDDPSRPEAVVVAGPMTRAGVLRGRKVRRILHQMVAPPDNHLLGFPGSAWPYWEFRGGRPSIAIVTPSRGPLLFERSEDATAWVRFGWYRTDNWLPVQDPAAQVALASSRRRRLSGKHLANALGFRPAYLVVAVSRPRDGYCSKSVLAILPRS